MSEEDFLSEQAALRDVFDKEGYGSSPRDLLLKVIVKQALSGAPWREFCAAVMKQHAIDEHEVETLVQKIRKKKSEGNSNKIMSAAACFSRGKDAFDAGRLDEAIEDYTRTLEIEKKHRLAFINRGLVYGRREEFDKAVLDFSSALELLQNDLSNTYLFRGLAMLHLGNFENAIEDCNKAIMMNPENAHAYYNRAIAHASLEANEKAAEDYSMAARLDPDLSVIV
jgi:tetratricopeptide (TPR) repeat protein